MIMTIRSDTFYTMLDVRASWASLCVSFYHLRSRPVPAVKLVRQQRVHRNKLRNLHSTELTEHLSYKDMEHAVHTTYRVEQ